MVCSWSHTTLTSANSSVQFDLSINVPSHGSNWSMHTYSSFNGVSSLNYSTANETQIASTSCANASIPSHILLRSHSVWAPSPSCLSGPWNTLSDILAPYSGSHQTCSGTLPHNQDVLLIVIGHYFCSYFSSIFNPTSLHIPYPTFLLYAYLCYVLSFMLFMLTNRQQEHDSIGTTGHRTTRLLGYRHPETVLLWFLLHQILCWNLLHHNRMLLPLKVLDFPDTEHE